MKKATLEHMSMGGGKLRDAEQVNTHSRLSLRNCLETLHLNGIYLI